MASASIPPGGRLFFAHFPDEVERGVAIKLTPQALKSLIEGSANGEVMTLTLGANGVSDRSKVMLAATCKAFGYL